MALSDRELTLATFLAVAALAKRLTGESLCVTLPGADGHIHSITGDKELVTWHQGESAPRVSVETLAAAKQLRHSVVLQDLPLWQ